jgi:uncharacterized pyridoxamine 5'-phosphate oxidase family protein
MEGITMKQDVVDYLTHIPCWFLATTERNQPRVRPFSFAALDKDRIWFCTATNKDVYQQLKENPRFELSGWEPGHGWIVVTGRAGLKDNVDKETRQAGYEHMTALGESYNEADDPRLTFFSLEEGSARFVDIDGSEQTISLDD